MKNLLYKILYNPNCLIAFAIFALGVRISILILVIIISIIRIGV